ncbi:MAG: T9SS type A sorting domain-containing protein [Prevotella sp.]|nr:T9SS type A sorting domain-containing protein [Prevotella sp.]
MKKILLLIILCLAIQAQAQNQCTMGDDCPPEDPEPLTTPLGDTSLMSVTSYDPNELLGPVGVDSVRWVSINDILRYTIMFENDPDFATAPAQTVDIRFDFPTRALMQGFGIGSYSFSNMSFVVDRPSNAYQTRINLRDTLGYCVDLIAGLDMKRRQGFWHFYTIDPATGHAPTDIYTGMLPVNDSTHVGEGMVTFQLTPDEEMHTGDTISIFAKILFDQNDTIPTNRWCVTVDAGAPTSKVTATPDPNDDSLYLLHIEASDDEGGSGLSHFLLYQANINGAYEEVDTCQVDEVVVFPVEKGRQYRLFTIAVDRVGNREPLKTEPDVVINFNLAPTDLVLSDSIFQDDLEQGGFIGKLSTVDTEENTACVYELAEGEGAIHNDLFIVENDELRINNSFKCAEDSVFLVRIKTTDDGGMTFAKPFTLHLQHVLQQPMPDSVEVTICQGDAYDFHGKTYDKAGLYTCTVSNDYQCDSIYVLKLSVLKPLDAPSVTVEGTHTLVSSAETGNQWFDEEGRPIEGADGQRFTPTEEGVYYVAASNGGCFSQPSTAYRVILSDDTRLTLNLKSGWNWFSSNLADTEWQDARRFLQPITESTDRLVGMTDELINDPVYGLTGGLDNITPTNGYKLHVTEDVNHTWEGTAASPSATPVTLHEGWNWIGYVPMGERTVADALQLLQPTENDIIKGVDDFATFSNGKWTGTLTALRPGEGFLYYSGKGGSFAYPNSNAYPVIAESASHIKQHQEGGWTYDAHRHADNVTLIGQPLLDGFPVVEGAFSVAAFIDGECRGIGRYVEGRLFMTIHGDLAQPGTISFKAVENATGRPFDVEETLTFGNQRYGTLASPVKLHLRSTTDDVATTDANNRYVVYPRPLHNRLFIQGDTRNILSVNVISTGGETMLKTQGYPEEGINVSGLKPDVYVVAIVLNHGATWYEKVVKILQE